LTGRPCGRGHVGERYTSSGSCKRCISEAAKERYRGRWPDGAQRTPEQRLAQTKAWRLANPERHKGHRLKKYGITYADFTAMLDRQDSRCAICRDPLDLGKNTHVDHCHDTGAVRGILCNRCNVAIGLLRNDPGIALGAARYLREAGK
jgi:hypothetical protein